MTTEERNELLEEIELLKMLLDFHVQNRQYISMSDHEFEEYANAVLDRLNELNDLLNFKNPGE
jgi:ribosome assembly protein YihI (activator of Der GTPase)